MEGVYYGLINLACLALLMMELVSCLLGPDHSLEWELYTRAIVLFGIAFFADMVFGFLQLSKDPCIFWKTLLCNAYNVGFFGGVYVWFVYSEISQKMAYIKKPLWRCAVGIPAALCILLSFTGNIFYFTPDGVYHRSTGVYSICSASVYLTLLITGGRALLRSLNPKYYLERETYRVLYGFLVPPLLFSVFQMVFPGNVPSHCIGIALSCMLVYQNHQDKLISRDPLTNLNNRRELVGYLAAKIKNHKQPLYLLFMDVDDFKHINDTYGHIEGDAALKQMAKSLVTSVPRGLFIARYAGDEFVVAGECENEEEAAKILQKIKGRLDELNAENGKPWKVTASIGFARYEEGMGTVPAFIQAADQMLYKEKQRRKAGR